MWSNHSLKPGTAPGLPNGELKMTTTKFIVACDRETLINSEKSKVQILYLQVGGTWTTTKRNAQRLDEEKADWFVKYFTAQQGLRGVGVRTNYRKIKIG